MNGCHSKYLHCALLVNISLMRWKRVWFNLHGIIGLQLQFPLIYAHNCVRYCLRTTQFKVGSTSLARNHKVGGSNSSNIKLFCYQNRPRSISRYVIISSVENITIRTALERRPYATHMHIWKMQHNTIKPAGQQCLVAQRPHKPHEITNSDYRQHSRKM